MKLSSLLFILVNFLLFNTSFSQSGWQLQNPKFTNDINNCTWVNASTAILGGFNRSLVKTTDGGNTWQLKTNGISPEDMIQTVQTLGFINESTGYILTSRIYKTVNGGETWTPISNDKFSRASIAANGIIYGVRFDDVHTELVKTTDDGITWNVIRNNVYPTFAQIKFINSLTGFYTSQDASTVNLKTTDGGNTWIEMHINASGDIRNLSSISFTSANTGFGLSEGRMFKTIDSGLNWFEVFPTNFADEIHAISDNIVLASTGGAGNRKLAKSLDGGATWSSKDLPEYLYVSFYNSSIGFAFYQNGIIYKTSDLGDSFTNISSKINLTADMKRIQTISSQNAYALSSDGKLFSTVNSGSQWNRINSNVSLIDFKFYNQNSAIGSTSSNIVISNDGGQNWQTKISASNANDFQIIEQNKFFYRNKENGISKIFYSDDNGTSSSEVYSYSDITSANYYDRYVLQNLCFINSNTGYVIRNNYYSGSLGSGERCSILRTTNRGVEWTALQVFTYSPALSLSAAENFVYYTNRYGVYKSTDFGDTWNTVNSEMGDAYAIKFPNSLTGYIGRNNNIYKTINGGVSWVLQTSAETVRGFEMYNSEIGYAYGEAGTIYYTNNGGNVGITQVSNLVTGYKLSQNYPNPFNPTTKINFSIPKTGLVQLKIYDMLGREVQTLLNEMKTSGEYSINFNGNSLSSGVYFYKLITNEFVATKKMILVK